ncbi:MAG: hypothetical protein WKF87_06815 [Chryseolinea sp.]
MSFNILNIISPGLIQQLDLKPLQGDDRAEFRLTRAGMIDPTSTRQVSTPQFQGIAPFCDINDPYDNDAGIKRIMNINGYNPIKGKTGDPVYMDPIAGYVRFMETGSILCTSQDNNLYFFLKLHNKNRDNINRRTKSQDGRGIPVLFYEVNVGKEMKLKTNQFDYQYLASKLIFEADEDALFDIAIKLQRAYPKKYTFDMKAEINALKSSLQTAATSDSLNFILAVKEATSLTRVLVDDTVTRRNIFFDDHSDKKEWCWKRTPGEKGKKRIIKLEEGNNPVAALVDFLTTPEGSEDMVEIRQLYEKHYNVR